LWQSDLALVERDGLRAALRDMEAKTDDQVGLS
jgi:hypothetical protein